MLTYQKEIQTLMNKVKCRVNGCLKNTDKGICDKCTKRINGASIKKRASINKSSHREYPKALKEAKTAFQLLRRLQESDDKGYCNCVHGTYRKYNACDGGHLFPAIKMGTCFDPLNVHPQEKYKNMDMMNPTTMNEYVQYFVRRYGQEEYEKLEVRANLPKKYSTFELLEMKKDFEKEIQILKQQKNIK